MQASAPFVERVEGLYGQGAIGAAAVADAEVQGWKLVPYGNNGDFYIVNTGGKYLTHATDHFEIKAYRSGAITVFRLVEDEVNRNAFQIVLAQSNAANNTLGMASTTNPVVRETTLPTSSTCLLYPSDAADDADNIDL